MAGTVCVGTAQEIRGEWRVGWGSVKDRGAV